MTTFKEVIRRAMASKLPNDWETLSSLHGHGMSQVDGLATVINGLQIALDGKSLAIHTHGIGDITSLQTTLDGKASLIHTHSESDITGLVSDLAGKSPTSHAHAISDVTGLQTALDGKAAISLVGAPVTRTLSLATAYQPTTTTKAAVVTVIVDITTTVGIGAPQSNTVELITGSTNAVASGTGTLADTYRSDLSVTLISLGVVGRQKLVAFVPAGWYFAVRRTVGTGITIISAFDQALG